MEFLTADHGFSSIQGTQFGFCEVQMVFDAWILLSTCSGGSQQNVPDINCEAQDQCVIGGSGSQIRGAGSEIRRDPPQFNPWLQRKIRKKIPFRSS